MQYKAHAGRRVRNHVQRFVKNKLMLRVGVTSVIRFKKVGNRYFLKLKKTAVMQSIIIQKFAI
jgi:hypothetical protein